MRYEPKIDTQLHYHGDVVCSFINTFFYAHQVFSVVLTSFTESLTRALVPTSTMFYARVGNNALRDPPQCQDTFFAPRCSQASHSQNF